MVWEHDCGSWQEDGFPLIAIYSFSLCQVKVSLAFWAALKKIHLSTSPFSTPVLRQLHLVVFLSTKASEPGQKVLFFDHCLGREYLQMDLE